MVSETGGDTKGTHKVQGAARKAVEGAEDAVRRKREQVTEALDDAGGAIGEEGNEGSRPVRESAAAVKARLSAESPIATVLVASAVVICGGLLVTSLLDAERESDGRTSGASMSGRAGADAVTKIRDAAI